MHEPKPNPRRWFQVSLRSIFLLMLVVGAYFAGYRMAVRQAEQSQQAEREARLEAERSAAEAKLAEEAALREAQIQAINAANAALRARDVEGPQSKRELVEPEEE